jgi:tetratricopeptide (TPR) repeat protein
MLRLFPPRLRFGRARRVRRLGVARAVLLLVLLAGMGAPAWGAEAQGAASGPAPEGRLVLDAAQVWDFAESLYRQGEYYRAVSEYQRLLYYFPQSAHAPAARVRIGEAYLLGGEPAQAWRHFDALLARSEPEERDGLLYRRGLAWLERYADRPYSLRLDAIGAGLRDLRGVAPASPEGARVAPFLAALEAPHDVPSRSPLLAGSLSAVIPGLGSVYVGRYAEGGLAFFVNALLISATVSSFQHDQPALGSVLGVFALAFYGGSIYAAASGAHKFNDRAQAAYLDDQRTRFGILLLPGGAGATIQRNF